MPLCVAAWMEDQHALTGSRCCITTSAFVRHFWIVYPEPEAKNYTVAMHLNCMQLARLPSLMRLCRRSPHISCSWAWHWSCTSDDGKERCGWQAAVCPHGHMGSLETLYLQLTFILSYTLDIHTVPSDSSAASCFTACTCVVSSK